MIKMMVMWISWGEAGASIGVITSQSHNIIRIASDYHHYDDNDEDDRVYDDADQYDDDEDEYEDSYDDDYEAR